LQKIAEHEAGQGVEPEPVQEEDLELPPMAVEVYTQYVYFAPGLSSTGVRPRIGVVGHATEVTTLVNQDWRHTSSI
jgi:hypothetical protein